MLIMNWGGYTVGTLNMKFKAQANIYRRVTVKVELLLGIPLKLQCLTT